MFGEDIPLTVGAAAFILGIFLGGGIAVFVGTQWLFQAFERRSEVAKMKTDIETQISALDAKANLALNQNTELRAEVAERYVSKEGFREALANLRETVKTGFDHLTETSRTNFDRLDEKMDLIAERFGRRRPERRETLTRD